MTEAVRKAATRVISSPVARIFLVAIISTAVAWLLNLFGFVQELGERTLGISQKWSRELSLDRKTKPPHPQKIHPKVLLVAIDNGDLAKLGKYAEWPRELQARMLAAFTNNAVHPKAIGYDILFTISKEDEASRASDQKFSDMLRELGNVCLAGNISTALKASEESFSSNKVDGSWIRSHTVQKDGVALELPFKPETAIDTPAPIFTEGTHFGVINAIRDDDGVHRRMPILAREGRHWIPSLSFRLAMMYYDVELSDVRLGQNVVILRRSDGWQLRIPVEPWQEGLGNFLALRVNYRGTLREQGDFPAVPFRAVLDWAENTGKARDDPELQKFMKSAHDGVVLIGVTFTGADIGATPIHPGTALVDCHLNIVNNLLLGDFLRVLPARLVPLIALVLALLAAWGTQKLSAVKGAAIVAGALALFLGCLWFLFAYKNIWISPVIPLLGLVISYTSGTTLRFMGEERQKRQLRRTFQNYLSANIMEEVLKNPEAMQMGGTRKDLTVLFTDVRGFTSFCEKNPPEEVVPVLNELLEVSSEVIARHDGTLDKYIGDAIMAFWGAPIPQKNHPELAARAALGMRDALAKLRQEWEQRGLPPLHLGIGINTGEMVVGNMGSSRLRNYTLIGDEVNLGARLESETRKFDTDIIISESTASRLGDGFRTTFLAEVTVKGKAKPVRIYSLDGLTA